MSTAAPAAAAGSAPSAAPVAPAGAPDTGAQPDAAAAKPIVLKPIPPKTPKLPGVMDDGPEPATQREADPRARDAGGRFVKTGEGEPVQKPQPKAVEVTDGIPDLPDAKPKFKFAGKEYDDQAAAEREFKGHLQNLQPTQRRAAEFEANLVKAAESARGWHAEAQRLQAELAQLRANPQPAQPEAAPETKGIDWQLYAEIAKVAQEAGEPWKAQQWLQEQVDAQRKADFDSWRAEFEAPFKQREAEAAEYAQMESTANALVESMAAHTNPDGSPAFPEFRDGNTAREVGELWQSLGLDPRAALTPGGAVAAVALYRMAKGMDAATPAPSAPNSAAPSPLPDPAALAAAGLEGGRPLLPSAADRRALEPGVARLVAGLKQTQLTRPGLGFEA